MASATTVKIKADWIIYGAQYDWRAPQPAKLFWRLPIIRHVRWFYLSWRVERHYAFWCGGMGMARTGYDDWALYGVFHGWC